MVMIRTSSRVLSRTIAACTSLAFISCTERPANDQDHGPIEVSDDDDDESEDSELLPDPSKDEDDESESPDSSESSDASESSKTSESEEDSTEPSEEPEPKPGSRALVIKHGWDVPNAHALPKIEEDIKNSPFDGIVFSAQDTSRIFGSKRVSLDTMRRHLRGVEKISPNTESHYYMIMYVDQIPGGFTGEGADILIENARNLGKVLSKTPVKGIAFDNEVYKKSPWDLSAACPGLDREACGKVAFDVGKRMMAAMMESWPDLQFWAFFGPWLNDHRTYKWIQKYAHQNAWAEDDDVASEFVAGVFAASTEGPALFIDGGEFYGLRTRKDFAKTAEWTRTEMVKDSPFFPDDLRDKYAEQMKVGFGIYDDRIHLYRNLPKLNPRRWSDTIFAASKEADLVWVYTEKHDWWLNDGNDWPAVSSKQGTDGPVPEDWRIAAKNALPGLPNLLIP